LEENRRQAGVPATRFAPAGQPQLCIEPPPGRWCRARWAPLPAGSADRGNSQCAVGAQSAAEPLNAEVEPLKPKRIQIQARLAAAGMTAAAARPAPPLCPPAIWLQGPLLARWHAAALHPHEPHRHGRSPGAETASPLAAARPSQAAGKRSRAVGGAADQQPPPWMCSQRRRQPSALRGPPSGARAGPVEDASGNGLAKVRRPANRPHGRTAAMAVSVRITPRPARAFHARLHDAPGEAQALGQGVSGRRCVHQPLQHVLVHPSRPVAPALADVRARFREIGCIHACPDAESISTGDDEAGRQRAVDALITLWWNPSWQSIQQLTRLD